MAKNFNLSFEIDNILDEMDKLCTLVELTRNFCLNKEFQSVYYNLSEKKAFLLSEERNHYINMLTITINRLNKMKSVVYNNTPTIAADK